MKNESGGRVAQDPGQPIGQAVGPALTRVSLNMTERDLENVNVIAALKPVRNRTHAVSTALAFTRFIIDFLRDHPGAELMMREGANFTRIVMPELQCVPTGPVQSPAPDSVFDNAHRRPFPTMDDRNVGGA